MSYIAILYGLYYLSIGLIFLAVLLALYTQHIMVSRVTPKGLEVLKHWLENKNIADIIVGFMALISLTLRFVVKNVDLARLFIGVVIFIFSVALFYFSILNLKIWRGTYKK